jgi:predicted Zn-dependent peptidase
MHAKVSRTALTCAPTTFGPGDTLTLHMQTPHGHYLWVTRSDRVAYLIVYPAQGELKAALSLVPSNEFARVAAEGLRGAALEDAKRQTLGQLMLALESPTARMYRLASTAIYSEPYRSLDEVLRTVEALTEDELSAIAQEFFAPERQTVVSLGPNSDHKANT